MSNQQATIVSEPAPAWDIRELCEAPITELMDIAAELSVDGATRMRQRELVFEILRAQIEQNGALLSEGVLEVLPDGFGFLRGSHASYQPGQDDIYVSPSQIRRFDLATGDTIVGQIRPPKRGERYFALIKVESINFEPPEQVQRKASYDRLTPLHPDEKFDLEYKQEDLPTRIMDMLCPLGKGQRGLIVSPPRAGKTMLLQSVAHAITTNHPEVILLVLLIDERPEEVTEMARSVHGEVI